MIHHVVAIKRAATADPAEWIAVMSGLDGLRAGMPGFVAFAHGPEIANEPFARSHTHGFVAQFTTRTALETYVADPGHKALGARLVALCDGGLDGLTVFDFDTEVAA